MTETGSPRLIDLHVDWLLQYATETTTFDPALYDGMPSRLGQAEGYLTATSAAILSCYRKAEDWARHADPWAALGDLIARYEAEFAGRLLIGPADCERRREDSGGLTWGVLGVEGFDPLIRAAADLDHLPALFRRGVRVFQPTYGAGSLLAGSAAADDDRGLTDLGRAFLEALAGIAAGSGSIRAIVDLAHLNPASVADILSWFEADAGRSGHLIPVYSHGFVARGPDDSPRALTRDALRRLRALGGFVGLTPAFHDEADDFAKAIDAVASVPIEGQSDFEGIAVGTDFLGVDRSPSGLGTAPDLVAWLSGRFPAPAAEALIRGNGEALLRRLMAAPA